MSSGGSAGRYSAAVDPQRVGRPARLPEDHSSWDAEVVDAGARTGWLHLSNRAVLGLTRAELRAGLEAMTDHTGAALVADPSPVSRWETGRQQPPVEVTLGYERLLGLPAGRLLAPVRALRRATGDAPTGVPDEGVEELLEQALDGGPMDGGRWLRLAMALAWHDRFFLRADDAEEMAARTARQVPLHGLVLAARLDSGMGEVAAAVSHSSKNIGNPLRGRIERTTARTTRTTGRKTE